MISIISILARTVCLTLAATVLGAATSLHAQVGGSNEGDPNSTFETSFDCEGALSWTEQAVCSDPVAAELDVEMAERWRVTLEVTHYPEELRADQAAWLEERDRCRYDVTCLRIAYTKRLVELDRSAVEGAFAWEGRWTRTWGGNNGSTLEISCRDSDTHAACRFSLSAMAGANMGDLSGLAMPDGGNVGVADSLVYADSTYGGCRLVLRRVHRQIEVVQEGRDVDCGAGAGVYYAGRYVPDLGSEGAAAPEWNLLNLGIVKKPENDAELRRLLGAKAYEALVDRAHVVVSRDDENGLGAQVHDFVVRGVAPWMAALLMQTDDGRFWVAILGDDGNETDPRREVRYYSNAPGWEDRLPLTILNWVEGDCVDPPCAGDPPVRMMASGRVLTHPREAIEFE